MQAFVQSPSTVQAEPSVLHTLPLHVPLQSVSPQVPKSHAALVEATGGAPIPALLIKKGGDYPPFWDRENSFIDAMEVYYLGLRKNGAKLL